MLSFIIKTVSGRGRDAVWIVRAYIHTIATSKFGSLEERVQDPDATADSRTAVIKPASTAFNTSIRQV